MHKVAGSSPNRALFVLVQFRIQNGSIKSITYFKMQSMRLKVHTAVLAESLKRACEVCLVCYRYGQCSQ